MKEFIEAEPPCMGIGLVEEQNRQCGFLALRPAETIPPEVSAGGFNFGHSLLGTEALEVIYFGFEFYGFKTYNVLINPNNRLVQAVLDVMIEGGDYFLFALSSNNRVTAFRADIGQEALGGLKDNRSRIRNSTTTDKEYLAVVGAFSENPEPEGAMLNWVCRDNFQYLDISKDPLELTPS